MVLLDPGQAYYIHGAADNEEKVENENADRPNILHLRLSASVLESIIANQDGQSPARLTSLSGSDPLLLINEERHSLHFTAESNPHQLYSLPAGSTTLQKVGDISSKLSIGPEPQSSSSATTRLKERRELEEARKTEHRTVLLNTAPITTRSRPLPSTSKLKLRAKGLAPAATNAPLIRSRANTPIEAYSLPGSPNLGPSNVARTPPTTSPALLNIQGNLIKSSPLSHSIKIRSSPPTLRMRLIQLLAKGPISKSSIVQHTHQPEPAILTLLDQVGQVAPEYLRPAAASSRRVAIPANRRSLAPGQGPIASQNGDRGASTLYILRDEVYRQVLIKDWTEYNLSERLLVSEHMEAALKRLGLRQDSEEWKRLYPDGRTVKSAVEAVEGDEVLDDALSMKRDPSTSSSADSLSKTDATEEKPANKKKSNQDRLRSMKKNAKGKNLSRTSTPPPTASKAPATKKSKASNEKDGTETSKVQEEEPASSKAEVVVAASARSTSKLPDSSPATKAVKETKATTSRASATQKTATQSRSASRKEIEYTDSSDDDEMQLDDPALTSKKAVIAEDTVKHLVASKRASKTNTLSSSPDGKRSRQGVGSGAAFSSEPWLDVRSPGDWRRLAERFKRVYEDFLKGRNLLRDEEDMIRADLEQARREVIKSESSLQIDDEREEGEASPVDGPTRGIVVMDFDPPSFANVAWRSSSTSKEDKAATEPMSYEDLETLVLKLKEMEAQLTRMKGALQTSKKTLEMKATS